MNIDASRERAAKAISPIRASVLSVEELDNLSARSKRLASSAQLPEYYLVYFLLVDLLGFDSHGSRDKVAWSIPIDFDERTYLVEYRKMGLGVFAPFATDADYQVEKIARLIKRGVDLSGDYLRWRADKAVQDSQVSLMNLSHRLYNRYDFFREEYRSKCNDAKQSAGKVNKTFYGNGVVGEDHPEIRLRQEAEWLAFAVIDSFFSWTEHVFVHLAILQGKCSSAKDVGDLIWAGWSPKFKKALDISDDETNRYHARLVQIREQFRNIGTHGAFGGRKEAFIFNSGTGAVPVMLPRRNGEHSYRFGGEFDHFRTNTKFVGEEEIELIAEFIDFIQAGPLAPAWIHLDAGLDSGLTEWQRSRVRQAMKSEHAMEQFVEYETYLADKYANMEF